MKTLHERKSTFIKKLIEPKRVLVIWQAPLLDFEQPGGARYLVGEILNKGPDTILQYCQNEDVKTASKFGFIGLTAYPYDSAQPDKYFDNYIIEVLSRRLPPSSRADYEDYLSAYMIAPDAEGTFSPLALLAYTGGRLAGDGFSFCHTFEGAQPPFDFTFEIAGVRHVPEMNKEKLRSLLYKPLLFDYDHKNQHDKEAIVIICEGQILGYIPRGTNQVIKALQENYTITASIVKVNGLETRPNVMVYVTVCEK